MNCLSRFPPAHTSARPRLVSDWSNERVRLEPNGKKTLEERVALISQFRRLIEPAGDEKHDADVALWEDRSDATLERFLRARNYHLLAAKTMWLDHRAWRQSFGWVQPPIDMKTQLAQEKVCLQGLCRDGLPFVVVIAARHQATFATGADELSRFFVCETLRVACWWAFPHFSHSALVQMSWTPSPPRRDLRASSAFWWTCGGCQAPTPT